MTIEVKNLTKHYGRHLVLSNTSCAFSATINFLIGENGSGKTTLLNIIAKDLYADSGKVLINGKEDRNKRLPYLRCYSTLTPDMKVKTYLKDRYFLYHGQDGRREERIKKVIEAWKLGSVIGEYIKDLSSGESKKVQLASLFLQEGSYFLLDEPYNSLDNSAVKTLNSFLTSCPPLTPCLLTLHTVEEAKRVINALDCPPSYALYLLKDATIRRIE